MAKRKANGTIPGGQNRQETLESDSKSGRSQYVTEEGKRLYALKALKEERGVRLKKAFAEFLDVSGINFWGDLSKDQINLVLFQIGIGEPLIVWPSILS